MTEAIYAPSQAKARSVVSTSVVPEAESLYITVFSLSLVVRCSCKIKMGLGGEVKGAGGLSEASLRVEKESIHHQPRS